MSRKSLGWQKYCSKRCQESDPVKIQKRKETTLAKYGVDNIAKLESHKENNKKISLALWDKRSTDDRHKIFNKVRHSSFMNKDYILPSGNVIQLQGNEPKAVDELLTLYHEHNIVINNVPVISYIKPNGRKAKYYPDIFIPSENLIIEVKSKWTYSGKPEWLSANLLKEQATIAAGYKFKFMIY